MNVVVVIPIYRNFLTLNEKKSLIQCFKILYKHPITFIAPNNLDTSTYRELCEINNINFKVERFGNSYFRSVQGYSQLLLSKLFYERFSVFKFILIYQLDCWVFKDELELWCKKNYDFIGAPLVGKFTNKKFSYNMIIGNGGLSLRKTKTYIDVFSYTKNLLSLDEIIRRYDVFNRSKFWKRFPLMIFMLLGYRNSFKYFNEIYKGNEDNFWTIFLKRTPLELHLPDIQTAIEFSFERFPSKLYQLNDKSLPFGCHAWEKYEFELFWSKFIN